MAKEKPVRYVSPKGEAKYPWLKNPDYGTDQFPITQGQFKVNLLIPDNDECKELRAELDKMVDASFKDAMKKAKPEVKKNLKKAPPYHEVYDEDGNEVEGVFEFRFKMNHKITSKKTGDTLELWPEVYDAKGKKVTPVPAIYGGSILKVGYVVTPYFNSAASSAGVSLRLNAVQIIDLVSGGGGNASFHGFGEEEGYEASSGGQEFRDESGDDNADF